MHVATGRRQVHDACLRLVEANLVIGSAGNVSVRLDEHRAVVSAGGVPYSRLDPEDHPVVSLADGAVSEGRRAPTSELAVHLALLRALPEVAAVVHTHSRHAAAFSVARVDIPFIMNENLGPAAERVLVTRPYAPPASGDLGRLTLATFRRQPGSRAVLLANHGVVAVGASVEAAVLVAEQVEWIAEVYLLAARVGVPHVLTPDEQDAVAAAYGTTIARERCADRPGQAEN
jgi:L-fuculose-phosphate aldolase